MSSSQPALPSEPQEMGPTQMMMATPAPVLHLLTRMSPLLTHFTAGINVLLWKSALTPFTLIVLWWGVCLFGVELARYGLNAVLLAALGTGWIWSRATAKEATAPAKMDAVRYAKTLDDARALDSALADLSDYVQPLVDLLLWRDPHASLSATSYLLTSYPFVLALTIFVPLPHLFGSLGTLIICWNAPWFALVRRSLSKSLVVRWLGRLLLGILGGGRGIRREVKRGRRGFALLKSTLTASAAPPSFIPQTGSKASMATAEGDHSDDLHYTFTVYENQRWWVGLDWTQALLPNERPSWSDAHHAPVSPPTSFLLPAATTNIGQVPGDNKHKLKRTTEWRWVDDWTVRKATAPVDTSANPSAPQGKSRGSFSEWTSRLSSPTRRRGSDTPSSPVSNETKNHARSKSSGGENAIAEEGESNAPQGADSEAESDWDCDEQGWQYGDNAWAPLSSKGKIGRYTRRRAWQRTAVVVEAEEKIPANVATTPKASGSTETSSGGENMATSLGSLSLEYFRPLLEKTLMAGPARLLPRHILRASKGKVALPARIAPRFLSTSPILREEPDKSYSQTDSTIIEDYPHHTAADDIGHSTTGPGVGRHTQRTLASFSMADKVCVVTGAARGLGNMMARTFAESGSDAVVIMDLDGELAKQAAADIETWFVEHGEAEPGEIQALGLGVNVANEESVIQAFQTVIDRFGRIDVLVTAAGIVHNYPAESYPTDKFRQIWAVNVDGTWFCAREAAKHMHAKGTEGSIVLVGSMSGDIVNVPQPQSPYNASKAAIKHLAASLAVEWAKTGIRVNCLSPGYMLTTLTRVILDNNPDLANTWTSLTPMGRIGEPEDLKGAIIYLASDASKFTTGTNLVVDGAYSLT